MKLETARREQSAELAAFFKKFPVHGPVDLTIDRSNDFFAPYDLQSDASVTYTLRSEGDELLGLATFNIFDSLVGGRETRVAFGKDLRILETRKAILGWTQHFLPVMEEVRRVFGAESFFSVLNMNEAKALNAFVRPSPGKRPFPRYVLHRRFNLVSLHGRFPWAPEPVKSLRVRRGSLALAEQLADYIVGKQRERDLAFCLTKDDFFEALKRWRGLKLEDFLIALDGNERIVGCCAPWSAGGLEEHIPLRYNLLGHNFRQFLKFGRVLGWTRTLTKPAHRLKVEASLDFRYLSFLFADHADVFESLAWDAFEEARETEFLVYLQMRSDLHLRPPLSWISARLPHALYGMIPPHDDIPLELHPAHQRPALLEPFFV